MRTLGTKFVLFGNWQTKQKRLSKIGIIDIASVVLGHCF